MTLSDEELLLQYLSGDGEGFNELLRRYKTPLFTVIIRMVGNREDAEDLFQETFLRILKHAEEFDQTKRFSSWLFAIALNLCRDHLRRKARTPQDPPPEQGMELFPGKENPEQECADRELSQALEFALSALPPEQREVFALREFAGMSFKEIAELTGANLNTVLGRMHLAVKKLRKELEPFMENRE